MASNPNRAIPVYVLSGFLGSGKTTLLQRMLAYAKSRGEQVAVLMNEAGEVNLDGALVEQDIPMAEMLGGCICCSIKNDLGMELLGMVETHQPDVIWIESTGVAQPLEMMDAITEAALYTRLELRGLVTVVDTRHLLDRLRVGAGKTLRLMREQIRGAEVLVLNKTDLAAADEVAEVNAQLGEWNPTAVLVPAVRCEVDPEAVIQALSGNASSEGEVHRHGVSESSPVTRPSHDPKQPEEEQAHSPHSHHHQPESLHSHVHVLTHYLSGPVDSEDFESFLRALPEGVYRAKGIVTFTDTASRFLFQYAYKETDFMRITPQKSVPDVAVFLGEDFNSEVVRSALHALEQPSHHRRDADSVPS